jgi:imidazolonepropionase-like amidohydrolase
MLMRHRGLALLLASGISAGITAGITAAIVLGLTPVTLAQAPVTAFVGATLIDGTGAPPMENGVVVVRDGRIAAVGRASAVAIPPGATQVDLRGKTLLPGFVNAHGHVDDPMGTRANLERQLLLYGRYAITTVFSLGEETGAGAALRDAPARGRARLFFAGPVVDGNTAAAAAEAADRTAASKPDWIKIRVDDNNGASMKMPRDAYKAAIDRAHAAGLPIAAHLFYLQDAKQLLRDGIDLLAHSVRDLPVDAELIELARARNVCLVPTLMREVSIFAYETTPAFFADPFFSKYADRANVKTLSSPERQAQVRNNPNTARFKQVLELASRNMIQMKKAGVRVAMGTDSGAANRFQGYFEHMELELMVKAGLTPMQAIVAATSDAAACMKQAGTVGTLQPGAWADLAVYAASPALDIKNTKTLESVWVSGERLP